MSSDDETVVRKKSVKNTLDNLLMLQKKSTILQEDTLNQPLDQPRQLKTPSKFSEFEIKQMSSHKNRGEKTGRTNDDNFRKQSKKCDPNEMQEPKDNNRNIESKEIENKLNLIVNQNKIIIQQQSDMISMIRESANAPIEKSLINILAGVKEIKLILNADKIKLHESGESMWPLKSKAEFFNFERNLKEGGEFYTETV